VATATTAAAAAAPSVARAPAPAPWRLQFALLAAIWGSSFLCIKVLGREWAPLHVALGRVALGMLFLVAILAVRRTPLPRGRVWLHLAVVALLMNALPFWLFAYGETKVSSVLAGLWNATTPLLTLVAVLVLLRDERPDGRRVAGLAGGFAGVVVLLGPWRGLGGDVLLGHAACLGAAACYGLGVPYTRRHLSRRPEGGLALAGAQLICATAMLAAVAPLAGAPTAALSAEALASLAVLGVLGSGVAYILMHAIIRAAGPTTFSTVTYVIPVVSTALGVVVLSEPLGWNEPAGAAIVLWAMWWSTRRRAVSPAAARSGGGA
jgi:drug/metabolite transporter (DMT)-like permease